MKSKSSKINVTNKPFTPENLPKKTLKKVTLFFGLQNQVHFILSALDRVWSNGGKRTRNSKCVTKHFLKTVQLLTRSLLKETFVQ